MLLGGVSFWYGDRQALWDVSLAVPACRVTSLIGPSGCGKSTLLRLMNRMNDLVPGARIDGRIELDGADIHGGATEVEVLRRRVGMVFQKPNPFPKSVFENVAFGPRIQGLRDRRSLAEIVERSLVRAALWDEVKDRLDASALGLSAGQQQRLCIARALATGPEVILMDERFREMLDLCLRIMKSGRATIEDATVYVAAARNVERIGDHATNIAEDVVFIVEGRIVRHNVEARIAPPTADGA